MGQQLLTASLKSPSACCYTATSDGRSSTRRRGEVRCRHIPTAFTVIHTHMWIFNTQSASVFSNLLSSTGHSQWDSLYVWNCKQAGPLTVCRNGEPTWSWLFPVSSWSALNGGSGKLAVSLLVSVFFFFWTHNAFVSNYFQLLMSPYECNFMALETPSGHIKSCSLKPKWAQVFLSFTQSKTKI